ncbi:hypothetical protein CASFOL_012165 [Castilleja foliolosa]|uniref:Knottins-like domain-containing protein n=1 Tax=Castilleja foliolosa TaxID=1961234 RepID=A0ABD3DPK9_9LAMI
MYILTEWQGSAHDSNLLNDAIIKRNELKVVKEMKNSSHQQIMRVVFLMMIFLVNDIGLVNGVPKNKQYRVPSKRYTNYCPSVAKCMKACQDEGYLYGYCNGVEDKRVCICSDLILREEFMKKFHNTRNNGE